MLRLHDGVQDRWDDVLKEIVFSTGPSWADDSVLSKDRSRARQPERG